MRYANLTDKTGMKDGEDVNTYSQRLFNQWHECIGSVVRPGVVREVYDTVHDVTVIAQIGTLGDWSTYQSNKFTGNDIDKISASGNKTSPKLAKKLFADFWEIAPWRY